MSTLVNDPVTASLGSNGLNENASITLARLVCDTTIGTDDLVDLNLQNNFVLDLIAAVGPVVAFNAICRQLLKINNNVAQAYVGTAYAAIAENTYQNYLTSYVMTDNFSNVTVSVDKDTTFLEQQWQTLAAFANAGVPISQMIQVVDYHILMLFLTSSSPAPTAAKSLIYTNTANPYTTTYDFKLYTQLSTSTKGYNIENAKYVYAISTLAQNKTVVFGDNVPSDVIMGGLLRDPVYNYTVTNQDDTRVYGIFASVALVVSANNAIRSSVANFIRPVVYALIGSGFNSLLLRKSLIPDTNNTTFNSTRLVAYRSLLSTNTISVNYYPMVNSSGAGITVGSIPTAGTVVDPTQTQLLSASALSAQTAQQIYTSLAFTSTSSTSFVPADLTTLKGYGKTISEIRSVLDVNGKKIAGYNTPSNFATAGYTNSEISAAFSGLSNGSNYDFAVLIGVCAYENDATTKVLKVVTATNYNFQYVDSETIGASTVVSNLKTIIRSNDTLISVATSTTAAYKLNADILNDYKEYTSATVINDANAEPAILRFLHKSAAIGASYGSTPTPTTTGYEFIASESLPNMYKYSKLPYVLAASPSKLAPTAFLLNSEFGSYTVGSLLAYATVAAKLSDTGSTSNYIKSTLAVTPAANATTASAATTKFYYKLSDVDTNGVVSLTDATSKQYYTLGKFANATNYGKNGVASTSDAKVFDNGYAFSDVYKYMATSSNTAIENINTRSWPADIVFTHYSLLLNDAVAHIIKKLNPNLTPLSDDALLASATANYSNTWTTFKKLLLGPINSTGVLTTASSANQAMKFDNTSYKALLNAGATEQYIKIGLAKDFNSDNTTTAAVFNGLGLPINVAIYVASKASASNITLAAVATSSAYSRYARRNVYANAQQAAQQLTPDVFIALVWPVATLKDIMAGPTPLNITIADLLSLKITASEVDADGYFLTPTNRLAYHDNASRTAIVKMFYPSASDAVVAQLAALYDADEILDFVAAM